MENKNILEKKSPGIRYLSGILFLTKISFILLFSITSSCKKAGTSEYTVMQGYFKQSVTETGSLDAKEASSLIMPRISYQYGYQFKVIGLVEHGKTVHRGDSVIMIDPSSIYKYILDREDQLENEVAASTKLKVEMENAIQDLSAQVKNEQASFDLKKLEVERMKFESENKRRIKELEFQQATIRLNKLKRNLELKPVLNAYDTRIQKIKVWQRESEINGAKETLQRLKIRSPQDGIFQVYRNMWSDQMVRLGDNVYIGSMIASIPDISRMKVKTYINEADINKIKPAMKAIIRLDALPKVPFDGTVTFISKICTERDSEKVFDIELDVLESDVRLKPGMTVSCEFICFESEIQLYVPNNCLLKKGDKTFVFIKKRGSPKIVEVITKTSNNNHTVIEGDIKPGQKLIPVESVYKIINI